MLESASWRRFSWRKGAKGRLAARIAATPVRIADVRLSGSAPPGAQHMPGEEAWLVGGIARMASENVRLPYPSCR